MHIYVVDPFCYFLHYVLFWWISLLLSSSISQPGAMFQSQKILPLLTDPVLN